MRNPYDLSNKHVAVIGLGSGGSAIADMLVRAGVRKLTAVDPDDFTEENLCRHILTRDSIGRPKTTMLRAHAWSINPECQVVNKPERFDAKMFGEEEKLMIDHDPGGRYEYVVSHGKPDVIACCADSDLCCQLVNDYSLRENVPVVYGAVWGAAETAEIIIVIPGKTPCYACYEREGPEPEPSQEKYTNPNYDATKMPHQEGLLIMV